MNSEVPGYVDIAAAAGLKVGKPMVLGFVDYDMLENLRHQIQNGIEKAVAATEGLGTVYAK